MPSSSAAADLLDSSIPFVGDMLGSRQKRGNEKCAEREERDGGEKRVKEEKEEKKRKRKKEKKRKKGKEKSAGTE